MLKPCAMLQAKVSFSMVNPETKRKIIVYTGGIFWVTTNECIHMQGYARIQRKGRGHMGTGIPMSLKDIHTLFDIID